MTTESFMLDFAWTAPKYTKSPITAPKKYDDHPYHPNIGSTPPGPRCLGIAYFASLPAIMGNPIDPTCARPVRRNVGLTRNVHLKHAGLPMQEPPQILICLIFCLCLASVTPWLEGEQSHRWGISRSSPMGVCVLLNPGRYILGALVSYVRNLRTRISRTYLKFRRNSNLAHFNFWT